MRGIKDQLLLASHNPFGSFHLKFAPMVILDLTTLGSFIGMRKKIKRSEKSEVGGSGIVFP